MNFLSLTGDESVTSVLAVRKEEWEQDWNLLMVTQNGVAKKCDAGAFKDVRRSGLIALTLKSGDELIAAMAIGAGEDATLITKKGQAIRFNEADVRTMGRTAAGVTAMKIGAGDTIVSAGVIRDPKNSEILIVTEHGYGKTTPVEEYKLQKRGGSGIKTAQLNDKTGAIVGGVVVTQEERNDGELVIMSRKGQVIKLSLSDVPTLGRQTQGVRVMKMRSGDAIASIVFV